MKKWFIGLTLIIVMGGIGTTYGYWNKTLKVTMSATTGSFQFQYGKEDDISADIVNSEHEVLDTLEGVEMTLSEGQKEAAIQFTRSLPLKRLIEGDYIRLRYPLVLAEGAVYPSLPEEPDFSEPMSEVQMEGKFKGICLDGIVYDYPGDMYDYSLTFELFNQVYLDGEDLCGYLYLRLDDESRDLVNSMNETMLTVNQEDLQEAADRFQKIDEQEGILVEYSGELIILFNQMNEADQTDEAGLHRNEG